MTRIVNTQGSATVGPVQTQWFEYDMIRQVEEAWSSKDNCATNPSVTGNANRSGDPYDSTTGRFTSVDPVVTPRDPQQSNGYTYASNNPRYLR